MREKELTEIEHRLKSVLGPRTLEELSRTTAFVKRRRTITAGVFIASLLKSLGSRRVESIADLLRDFNYDHQESVCYKVTSAPRGLPFSYWSRRLSWTAT